MILSKKVPIKFNILITFFLLKKWSPIIRRIRPGSDTPQKVQFRSGPIPRGGMPFVKVFLHLFYPYGVGCPALFVKQKDTLPVGYYIC